MKIELEFIEQSNYETNEFSGWKVTISDKYANGLCYDEMIGLITVLTSETGKPCLNWLKTKEQHEAYAKMIDKKYK